MLQLNHTTKCSTDVINGKTPSDKFGNDAWNACALWLCVRLISDENPCKRDRLLTVSIGRVVVVNTP